MSAQHVEQPADQRVAPIARTIGAIRAALPDDQRRQRFLAEVLAAPVGAELDRVVTAGWYEAMLSRAPGGPAQLDEALNGANQVPLPDLLLVHGE